MSDQSWREIESHLNVIDRLNALEEICKLNRLSYQLRDNYEDEKWKRLSEATSITQMELEALRAKLEVQENRMKTQARRAEMERRILELELINERQIRQSEKISRLLPSPVKHAPAAELPAVMPLDYLTEFSPVKIPAVAVNEGAGSGRVDLESPAVFANSTSQPVESATNRTIDAPVEINQVPSLASPADSSDEAQPVEQTLLPESQPVPSDFTSPKPSLPQVNGTSAAAQHALTQPTVTDPSAAAQHALTPPTVTDPSAAAQHAITPPSVSDPSAAAQTASVAALTGVAQPAAPAPVVAAQPNTAAAQPTRPAEEDGSVLTSFFGYFGSSASAPERKLTPINAPTKPWALESSEAAAVRLCSLDAPAGLPFTPVTETPAKRELSAIFRPTDASLIDIDQDWRGVKKVKPVVVESAPVPERPKTPPKKNCLIS